MLQVTESENNYTTQEHDTDIHNLASRLIMQ